MVPGDLFQGFPGPTSIPLKNVGNMGLGVFGVGSPPMAPVGCLVAYVGSSLIWPKVLLMVGDQDRGLQQRTPGDSR